MKGFLLAGLGGFVGSVARYGVGIAMLRNSAAAAFPLATLVVNVVGSFLIGLLISGVLLRGWLSHDVRVFVIIGVLGGFTTFSSFSLDTLQLWREQGTARAGANVLLNVALCLIAVWLGDAFGRMVAHD
jgi:CrcB protein